MRHLHKLDPAKFVEQIKKNRTKLTRAVHKQDGN